MNKAIFLDRDGVLNKPIITKNKPFSPLSISEFKIYSDVSSTLDLLRKNDFELVVITNQPEVARGNLDMHVLMKLHDCLVAEVGDLHFYICTHDDSHNCECRKPKPGLILKASRELDLDIANSYLIGDRWKDIAAGQAAGCKKNYWINREYSEYSPAGDFEIVYSLMEAVNSILAK